jgi:cell division protein ZapA
MGKVSITVNGRTFKLQCGEGEEPHLLMLADYLNEHVSKLRQDFGNINYEQLLIMAGLTVGDELWEARTRLNEMSDELNKLKSAILSLSKDKVSPTAMKAAAIVTASNKPDADTRRDISQDALS